MPAPPLFNFFTYAAGIDQMLTGAFSSLKTVAFPPTPTSQEFTESRFGDIALPAFVMNFENPELDLERMELNRLGEELADDGSYYMPMIVRVAGYLLLPVFSESNTDVPNVNPSVLLAQSTSNIAAKIYAQAQGWNCGVATIDSIRFVDDSARDLQSELPCRGNPLVSRRLDGLYAVCSRCSGGHGISTHQIPAGNGSVPGRFHGTVTRLRRPGAGAMSNMLAELTARIAALEAARDNMLQLATVSAVDATTNLVDLTVRGVQLTLCAFFNSTRRHSGTDVLVAGSGGSGNAAMSERRCRQFRIPAGTVPGDGDCTG